MNRTLVDDMPSTFCRFALARAFLCVAAAAAMSGCTANVELWQAPEPPPFPSRISSYFLSTECERCLHPKLDAEINAAIRTALPAAERVGKPEAADLVIIYEEGDSLICLDCDEEPIRRDWWWWAKIYAPPGDAASLISVLSGDVYKLRGRPARFFAQQWRAYFSARSVPPSHQ